MRYAIPIICLLAAGSLLITPSPAAAYIGPGSGITLLGALWAVLIGVVLTVFGLLAWPIRSMLRRRRQRKAEAEAQEDASDSDSEEKSE